MKYLKENIKILFMGDSITDAGRYWIEDGMNPEHETSLGEGYANMVATTLNVQYPELKLKFFNRGIGGNKASDLKERWQTDCLDLKPDVLTLMIGINDTWSFFAGGDEVTATEFEEHIEFIIKKTIDAYQTRIVVLEPFLLPYGYGSDEWRSDFSAKVQVLRKVARKYQLDYIPLDGLFAKESTSVDMSLLVSDGVHPTTLGHRFIAKALLAELEQ